MPYDRHSTHVEASVHPTHLHQQKCKPAKGFAMWQKGSAARVRDEVAVLFPKKKNNPYRVVYSFIRFGLPLSFWGPKSCDLEVLCK